MKNPAHLLSGRFPKTLRRFLETFAGRIAVFQTGELASTYFPPLQCLPFLSRAAEGAGFEPARELLAPYAISSRAP